MPESVQTSCPAFLELLGIKPQNKLSLLRILWLNLSPLIPFDFLLERVVFKKILCTNQNLGFGLGLSIEFTYPQPNKIVLDGFL